jgi:hypothetical protein
MQEDEECSVLRWVAFEIVQACKIDSTRFQVTWDFQSVILCPNAKILYLD